MTDNRINPNLVIDLATYGGRLAGAVSVLAHGDSPGTLSSHTDFGQRVLDLLSGLMPDKSAAIGRSEAIAATKAVLQLMLSELEAHP